MSTTNRMSSTFSPMRRSDSALQGPAGAETMKSG
jgi:hypothetical protein